MAPSVVTPSSGTTKPNGSSALLHAAALHNLTMVDAAAWALAGNLTAAVDHLRNAGAGWPMAIVEGLAVADSRYRDSVLATASNALRVYDHTYARAQARQPSFDIEEFLASRGTLYIVAASEQQDLLAPLVVGLIDDVLRHSFKAAHQRTTTLLLALDELARIAPLRHLPGWLAEAGSHQVQVLAILQDLSQARDRWGRDTADGLPTLFRHKLLLPGILDHATLSRMSQVLGEDVYSTAPGNLTLRPRWTPHALASPSPGTAIHIDRADAHPLSLLRLYSPHAHVAPTKTRRRTGAR